MTKAHSLAKKNKKQNKMGVKDGLVVKKKNQAFKNTPTGKVPLVKTNKKQQNGKNANGQVKGPQKGKGKKPFVKKQIPVQKAEDLEDEDLDSENESMDDSDDSVDETTQKKGVKMFKGLKKADESDDDDDDDEEDQDLNSSGDSDEDDDEDDDDDDEEDDDEDENEELDDSKPGLKALLGESLADDDDDDDFNEDDESDDDNDMSDDDDEVLESSNLAEDDDEEDDDEDDDDDDDDDEDEEEETSGLGLKALLGDSLVDEDDDDDFEGEDEDDEDDEDDDISGESDEDDDKNESIEEKKLKGKELKEGKEKVKLSKEELADQTARTIYIGNIPKETTKAAIKKLFRPFGEIDNLRIRGVVPEDSRMSPKVAAITKKMHPKVLTVHAYVVFKNKDSTKEALTLNGHKLGENHLRVDLAKHVSPKKDEKKAVFLGNLPFEISEEEVRAHFVSCGKIDSVRIMRDRNSGLSRGVGYINFENEDSVALALELNNTKVKGREVRVKMYSSDVKSNKRRRFMKNPGAHKNPQKKFKDVEGKPVTVKNDKDQNKQKRSQGKAKREKSTDNDSPNPSPIKKEKKSSFQGKKADTKKKPKANKLDKKKKILAQKLTSTKKASKTTD